MKIEPFELKGKTIVDAYMEDDATIKIQLSDNTEVTIFSIIPDSGFPKSELYIDKQPK